MEQALFKLLAPRVLGGHEADPQTLLEVVEEVAAVDASAGWTVGVAAICSAVAGFLEPDVAWEMFGSDPRACLVGSGVPAKRPADNPPEVQQPLAAAWTAANGICGKHLVPFRSESIPTLEVTAT